MKTLRRMTGFIVFACLILGIGAPVSGNAGDRMLVRGIVDYTDEDVLTISGHRYDIKGAPIRNVDGTKPEGGEALRGKLVEIRYFKGKIVSVTVSLPMPQ